MKVKTYGVPGLTEWHGKVKAGTIEIAVSFTGGTASPSGAQPAYYMTKDPITQFVIEHSKEFKEGFIILSMSQDAPGEHPRLAFPKPVTKPVTKPVNVVVDDSAASGENLEEPSTESGEPAAEGAGDSGDGAVTTSFQVEVADKKDAIEYLKEHFPDKDYTATKLRTQTAFAGACQECGVVFVYTA